MKLKETFKCIVRDRKNFKIVLGILATLGLSNNLSAQNTFYSADAGGNIGGSNNCAIGPETMFGVTGSYNTAIGRAAMHSYPTGSYNCAVGAFSLSKTSGSYNSAVGYRSLNANTTGSFNVASGYHSMYSNTTGGYNAAFGSYALQANTSGRYNSAFGYQALQGNTAENNTSTGFRSLYLNTTGANNTASGFGALYNNITGTCNTGIGYLADVSTSSLSNATAIGCGAIVNASNKVRVGNTTVTKIEGQVPFTSVSDGRFKTNIKEEDVKGLEFIKKLRPVVYNLDAKKFTEFLTKNMSEEARSLYPKQDFSKATAIRQSGFIAQEVEKAAKEVGYDFNGVSVPENEHDNYGLAYSQFVVPLVKGMQEQQKMIEDQQQMIEKLQQQVNELLKNQGTTTGIEQTSLIGASMEQNVPNPFTHETVVHFNLPQEVNAAYMTVYDLSGKQLKTLPINQRGASSITVTADQLAAGMYVYSIVADGKIISSKRMIVADK